MPYSGSEARATQSAFLRRDARHRCRTRLSRGRCSASHAFAQHPCHPKRADSLSRGAADPCYPTRPLCPCRRKRREGKMPLIELCNRPAGRAPEKTARFLVTSTRWRCRLTPRLQLRVCFRRLPAGVPRGEERRTGAAPRCSGVLSRAQRSKLDPLTPPVPNGPLSPTDRADSAVSSVKRHAIVGPGRLPSTGAPCVACAPQKTRHRPWGFAAAGSASCASPLVAFARKGWACRVLRGSSPRCRAGQALLSTSAITTVLQHDDG